MSQLVCWLGLKAEELGVEIYPGFAASEVAIHFFEMFFVLGNCFCKLIGYITLRFYMMQITMLLELRLMTWESARMAPGKILFSEVLN